MKKERGNTIIVVLLIIIVFLLGICGWLLLKDKEEEPIEPKKQEVVKNENSISIPGYGALHFRADSKEQSVSLTNPIENTCLFVMTLSLEDGTILWTSDYVSPGKVSKPIVLETKLEKGTYTNACLTYDCFTEDENHNQLNSAEIRLDLVVY